MKNGFQLWKRGTDVVDTPQSVAGIPGFWWIGVLGEQRRFCVLGDDGTMKKDKMSYYVGWGLAYGIFAGGMFSIMFPEHLLVILLVGSAFGAVIGVIFGKMKA